MISDSHKKTTESTELEFFLIDENGNIFGKENKEMWSNAKWYQKILGLFSKKYKNKFIYIEPIQLEKNEVIT